MLLSDRCLICNKPQAYQLVSGEWYTPPIGPYWTIALTITTHTTYGTIAFSPIAPDLYCYGHAFAYCPECGTQDAVGYHSAQRCALLKGLMQGIRQVAAYVERDEQIPASERLPGNVDVPEVFQEAFKEKERL